MRNGLKVMDTDSHQMEPPSIWQEYIDPAFADRAPAIGTYNGGKRLMMVEDEPITRQTGSYPMDSKDFHEATAKAMMRFQETRAQGFSAKARIADMDAQGVDAQVIYPTVGGQILGKPFKDPELLAAVCRAYNDWSLEYCREDSARLLMAAMLPMQSPQLACEEARRTAELGAACYYVRPNPVGGRNLYHESYEPLWTLIEGSSASLCAYTTQVLRIFLRMATAWTPTPPVTSSLIHSRRWWR